MRTLECTTALRCKAQGMLFGVSTGVTVRSRMLFTVYLACLTLLRGHPHLIITLLIAYYYDKNYVCARLVTVTRTSTIRGENPL